MLKNYTIYRYSKIKAQIIQNWAEARAFLVSTNRNIADVFFKAGYVEAWGRGANDITRECKEAGLPESVIDENQGGLSIVFLKDIYTEDYLRKLDINERQVKAILFIKINGTIANATYQEINGIGKTLATEELSDLVNIGINSTNGNQRQGR